MLSGAGKREANKSCKWKNESQEIESDEGFSRDGGMDGRVRTDASTTAIFIPSPISRAFASAAATAIFAPARVRLSLDCVIEDIS